MPKVRERTAEAYDTRCSVERQFGLRRSTLSRLLLRRAETLNR